MNRKIVNILIVIALAAIASGCASNTEKKSKATGWNWNDPKWGGFSVNTDYTAVLPPGTIFIEGGTFTMGSSQENLYYDYNNIPRKVTVSSFYMDETETRNIDYLNYLHWLDYIYGEEYPEYVRQAQPDEFVWRDVLSFSESMVETYFRHPAYKNYPVVGVSWEQASDYCTWRTDRVNELILFQQGIMDVNLEQTPDDHFNTEAYLAGQYVGVVKKGLKDLSPNATSQTRNVRVEDGIFITTYRLPTEAEWEFAAYGLLGNTFDERIVERKTYPWGGQSVRMAPEESDMGRFMANFQRGKGDYMGVAGSLNDEAEYTADVYSYYPNDYGLYNMAGNVSEWVLDVYRALTFEDMDAINPYRGNVYTTVVRDADGNIAEKDSLGRIRYRELTPEETATRRNFQRADNRNYGDGDYASTISESWLEAPEGSNPTDMVYEYGVSTLVTDKSRVVKGGSWKDRAYWLSPGERRFMQQDESTNWVGFRCAASYVGDTPKSGAKK